MYHETIPLFSCGIVEDHGQLFQSSRIYRVDYRENEYSLIGSLKNVKAALIERLIYYFEITYSKIATFFVFGSQHASFEVHKGGGRGGGPSRYLPNFIKAVLLREYKQSVFKGFTFLTKARFANPCNSHLPLFERNILI